MDSLTGAQGNSGRACLLLQEMQRTHHMTIYHYRIVCMFLLQAAQSPLTWFLMQKQHPTADEPVFKPKPDIASLMNTPDFLQTVQRLSDDEVRHSRETRPLAPSSYSAMAHAEQLAWGHSAQTQENISLRRNRQTLHGSSSSAAAAAAPLHQQEGTRGESDTEISTQFGGAPFVGGSTVRTNLA